ncbi:mannitol dehydrogenase family protein [Amycolatopsis pigmentata]|uniref:Mannitol-1-phosphate 5-dehydrogenase n=1 Tax=Amycolatopsis pigmentata TaxID=450801 RepID=A0ABW5FKI2_9PSEU
MDSTLTAATLSSTRSGIAVPAYERARVGVGIAHIGLGNFHRAHQAAYLDALFARDPAARRFGILGINLLAGDEPLARAMRHQDGLYTLLERHSDSSTCTRIIGSIVDNLFAPDDPAAIPDRLSDPGVRIVSLTITEAGYCHDPATGKIDIDTPGIKADLEKPGRPRTAFGVLVQALRLRRDAGTAPFTVLSCDNILGNGDLARAVTLAYARLVDAGLAAWIEENVEFPNSMVDRITPRTSPGDIAEAARATGLSDACPVSCEAFTQWIIEDRFPGGRPEWEQVGVRMVEDVRPYEVMKLRLVNAGHQSIAYAGSLLGHEFGWQACADPAVRGLLTHYLHDEGVEAVGDVPGVDLRGYCETVIDRFANPQISDTMTRLRGQPSTMLSTFVLPAARLLLARGRPVLAIAAIVACWTRVLEGHDDAGAPLPLADIRAEDLQARAARLDADPLAVIRDNPLFAGLDDHPGFTEPYLRTLDDLRRLGARHTLERLFTDASGDRP